MYALCAMAVSSFPWGLGFVKNDPLKARVTWMVPSCTTVSKF
jgi:hypothetical protein